MADHEEELNILRAEVEEWKDKYANAVKEIDCRTLDRERYRRYRSEVEKVRFDLSKPPKEREYCAGCSLPMDVERLRKRLASWDNINYEGPDEPTVFITKKRYDELISYAALWKRGIETISGKKEGG